MRRKLLMTLLILSLTPAVTLMQSGGTFAIQKSVVAGGGGRSAGGNFILDGTIGQSLAGRTSTGGPFELTGGFWGGSAAPVSLVTVSGRVTTPSGLPFRNAVVSLIDSKGGRRIATTGSLGVYIFENVASGESYTMTVTSKRYRFTPRFQLVQGTLTNIDFTGLE